MKPSLCLNMIVKNEGARIERALRSALPYVKSVAILDTGSTDDTVDVIKRVCAGAGVHFVVGVGEFVDYSQARNDAFALAKDFNKGDAWCQFALLMDADMELVVHNVQPLLDLNARSTAYIMIQKGGALSYHNTRLINLDIGVKPYVGVTHEYVDVPACGIISETDVFFDDHADGANRGGKYERDIRLLTKGLEDEPHNSRYMFYLANTYLEDRQWEAALRWYDAHIAANGWDEEVHQSMMNRAKCYRELGDEGKYLYAMQEAYNFRPSRAEPMYELARHYRDRNKPALALIYAKHGMTIPRPNDYLFVNEYVYAHGLRYEYSLAGYYNEAERNGAFQMTNDLALDPTFNAAERWSARTNLYWYLKPLKEYCPSFKDREIDFDPNDGYTAMNPCVYNVGDNSLFCNVRTVNYKINEHGQYMIGEKGCQDAPIDTINYVLALSDDLETEDYKEVVWERETVWNMVTGLEDMRLQHRTDGRSYFNACVREQCHTGTCQQWEGSLEVDGRHIRVVNARAMTDEHAVEKNWMPIEGEDGSYVYRLDKVINEHGHQTKYACGVHVGDISGGSQAIKFKGGWLMVVHEASTDPTNNKRTYWHRFAWLDINHKLRRLSLPFVFLDKQIEFCAGLARHPNGNDLVLSYGIRDAEAHLGTVSIEEVSAMIWKFHES